MALFAGIDSNLRFRLKVNKMNCSGEDKTETWGSLPLTSPETLRQLHILLILSIFLHKISMLEDHGEVLVLKSNSDHLTFMNSLRWSGMLLSWPGNQLFVMIKSIPLRRCNLHYIPIPKPKSDNSFKC